MKIEPIKILIIDDDWKENDPATVLLREKYGEANVTIIKKSSDGINLIKKSISEKIIVLLDLDLGAKEPNGVQVFEEIRRETSLIYIIIITAKDERTVPNTDLVKFINNDALAYITKSSGSKKILEVVEKAEHQLNTRIDCVLEQWLSKNSEEERSKPYLTTKTGETYSLNDIMLAIRKQDSFGKEMERKIIYLTIDLLARQKEKIDG